MEIGYDWRVLRVFLVMFVIGGCSKVEEAGRVEVDRSGKTVVVRDTMRVLELDLATSTIDHAFEPLELPVIEFPGRLAIEDKQRGRALLFWVTRLGAKRPGNIQRWFEGKLERLPSTLLEDRVVAFDGRPGRVADYVHRGDRKTRQRFIAVDLPEHDLVLVMLAIVQISVVIDKPKPDDLRWLDEVVADVQAMRVVASTP